MTQLAAPLCALHGFAGSPALWDGLWAALDARGALLENRRRPCLPFHHAPPAEDFADAAAQLWRACSPDGAPVHLVGYSLGGRLALAMALAAPERCASLTLIGVHPGLAHEADRAERRQQDARWQQLLREGGIEAFAQAWAALPLFATQARLPAEVRAAQQAARLQHDPLALAAALGALGLGAMPCMLPAAAALRMPVQLVCGAQDEKFRALMAQLARALPHSTQHVVPGAGHNVPLEAPDALAELLLSPGPGAAATARPGGCNGAQRGP